MIEETSLIPVGGLNPLGEMHDLKVYTGLSAPGPLNPIVFILNLYSSPVVSPLTIQLKVCALVEPSYTVTKLLLPDLAIVTTYPYTVFPVSMTLSQLNAIELVLDRGMYLFSIEGADGGAEAANIPNILLPDSPA